MAGQKQGPKQRLCGCRMPREGEKGYRPADPNCSQCNGTGKRA